MLAANVQCAGGGGDCRGHTGRGGGGGLTLLVPTLSGCMQSSWSFSVTTRCGLGLLRRRAGLLWLRGWGRRLGSGLRCRLAYLRSGGELCDGSRCSLGCRWRCGGVGGSRRGRSVRWGSSCRGSCPRFARLRCSQSLHDGGDPHSFLQEEGEQAEFKDGTVTWKLTQRTSTLTGFPQHYYSFLIKDCTTTVELCDEELPGGENKRAHLPLSSGEVLLYLCAHIFLDVLIWSCTARDPVVQKWEKHSVTTELPLSFNTRGYFYRNSLTFEDYSDHIFGSAFL